MVFHISANMASRFGALIDQMTPFERENGKPFELMKLIPPLLLVPIYLEMIKLLI